MHDISLVSVYYNVWSIIDIINTTKGLVYYFADHEQHKKLSKSFHGKSGAGFDRVIGAIDGIIIYKISTMPSLTLFREIECDQTNFR